MVDEGNIPNEVSYISGCISAHDALLDSIVKILVGSGEIEKDAMLDLIRVVDENKPIDNPEFNAGYDATLANLQKSLGDFFPTGSFPDS